MLYLFVLALLAVSALSQRISIGAPAEWSTVSPGSNITVQVERPLTLTGSEEVAIAIGLWPCARQCAFENVTDVLGSVLFRGLYAPQLIEPGVPPYQNFTVTVPSHFNVSEVSLNVAHFSLIGAGAEPFLETANITLNLLT